jgi:hypothetical protein
MAQFGQKNPYALKDGEKDLQTIVFEALGAVSMCWDPAPSGQVFESDRAKEIGDQLMVEILDMMRSKYVVVRESDLGRQRQLDEQKKMLDLSQKKFTRIIQILSDTSGSPLKLDRIRQAVVADRHEVASW